MSKYLSAFKAYDIRGQIDRDFDSDLCYRVARAFALTLSAKKVAVGYDIRPSSKKFSNAVVQGLLDENCTVLDIGLSGSEEVYWATFNNKCCGGIEVTASHNPLNYNGLKLVGQGSRPLNQETEVKSIKDLVIKNNFSQNTKPSGNLIDYSKAAKDDYISKLLSFLDIEKDFSLNILTNAGNGVAGPILDFLEEEIKVRGLKVNFIKISNTPDGSFPNGIPNPLLLKNQSITGEKVISNKADIGIAFDGDFDRCFFFDEKGRFIPGEYIVGLLAHDFLKKEEGARIIHDNRVIWNTRDIVLKNKGVPVVSKVGHTFLKKKMREHNAVYGGEISAHHYFRDFAYSDSGMLPWIIVVNLIAASGQRMSEIIDNRLKLFPSSGEINFQVKNVGKVLDKVLNFYKGKTTSVDKLDGISLMFESWRFSLRPSNTESLLRLNIETKKNAKLLTEKVKEIENIIGQ